MPSIAALFRVGFYWLLWLLVARRVLQEHGPGEALSTLCWLAGTAAVAAWFTWIKLHDDRKAQLHGEDDGEGPASPGTQVLGAVFLGAGGVGCLAFGALLPELRGPLLSLGFAVLVAAVLVLFFGRRSSSRDIEL